MSKATIQDYPSRMDDPTSKKFGVFSYLPAMSDKQIQEQLQYIFKQGWDCAVEHVEPPRTASNYWYMWKLPMFGETNKDVIMEELAKCRDQNPGNHVRVVAYNRKAQSLGHSIVVYRGKV